MYFIIYTNYLRFITNQPSTIFLNPFLCIVCIFQNKLNFKETLNAIILDFVNNKFFFINCDKLDCWANKLICLWLIIVSICTLTVLQRNKLVPTRKPAGVWLDTNSNFVLECKVRQSITHFRYQGSRTVEEVKRAGTLDTGAALLIPEQALYPSTPLYERV